MANETAPAYLDMNLSFEERARDLVSRMTLEEKISQMIHGARAIDRLGVPEYNWWNECLHGVGRAGVATVFPQAIGLAATWNTDLLYRIAVSIAYEGRAKYHDSVRKGDCGIYKGLTFWTPNVNIFRDPRWGRGQETYGEDPYLTSRMGVCFVKGLQGNDPRYLKSVATPKHFAVHSGPEADRHAFDATADIRELWETYLPAFKACVKEAGAASVMGAYNRTNGEPCCASPALLGKILREEWGFDGYVVSDCGAIGDIWQHHRVVETPEEASALAVEEGCDLNCGETFSALVGAAKKGLISEKTIDRSVQRLFEARFRLGMFDPEEQVPYAQIPYAINDCEEHRFLAFDAARESIVLLKNDGILPLSKDIESIALIGPTADDVDVLLGNYNGTPSNAITMLEGIRTIVWSGTKITVARGCDLHDQSEDGFDEAIEAAKNSDVAVMILGLSGEIEGEEGDGGDREMIELPPMQERLLKAVHATGTPVVVVLLSGSALAVPWANENASAMLAAWYPGEEGGTAVADVLFGGYNPGGRLPVTFYHSTDQLPPFEDYSMAGRTYRYLREEPLYPFGFGLSYTSFEYSKLSVPPRVEAGDDVEVRVDVRNTGDVDGDEVVQLYVTDDDASLPVAIRQLQGFKRVHLTARQNKTVCFTLTSEQLSFVTEDGRRIVEPGSFTLSVGGGQPLDSTPSNVLQASVTVDGDVMEIER
jgi:beta-glucosidase